MLQALGGWPVLDPNWTESKAGKLESVESLLGRLRGELNQGVLVEQWVGPDDKNSSVNIIQVSANRPACYTVRLLRELGGSFSFENRRAFSSISGRPPDLLTFLFTLFYYSKATTRAFKRRYRSHFGSTVIGFFIS